MDKVFKKLTASLLFLLLVGFISINYSFADETASKPLNSIQLLIDEQMINYDIAKYGNIYQNQEGVILAPLRLLAEQMQFEINWNAEKKAVVVSKYDRDNTLLKRVDFKIGSKNCTNGDENSEQFGEVITEFETAIFVDEKKSRIYLPIDAFIKAFDLEMEERLPIKAILIKSDDPNARYYSKPTAVEACGIYLSPKALNADNGRDLYRYPDVDLSGKPASPYYSASKDDAVNQLNTKWRKRSDKRLASGMFFSGFSIKDIGGANNIYVDFGRKDLAVVITRWSNSQNAAPIFKDVLSLFLSNNHKQVEQIYQDISLSMEKNQAPQASYKWLEIAEGVSYRVELVTVMDNGSEKQIPLIKVRLDKFWH